MIDMGEENCVFSEKHDCVRCMYANLQTRIFVLVVAIACTNYS